MAKGLWKWRREEQLSPVADQNCESGLIEIDHLLYTLSFSSTLTIANDNQTWLTPSTPAGPASLFSATHPYLLPWSRSQPYWATAQPPANTLGLRSSRPPRNWTSSSPQAFGPSLTSPNLVNSRHTSSTSQTSHTHTTSEPPSATLNTPVPDPGPLRGPSRESSCSPIWTSSGTMNAGVGSDARAQSLGAGSSSRRMPSAARKRCASSLP